MVSLKVKQITFSNLLKDGSEIETKIAKNNFIRAKVPKVTSRPPSNCWTAFR